VRDTPRVAFRNHLDRVDAALGGREFGAQDAALQVERREIFEWTFDPEVEVLHVLAHDDVVDAVGICERALEALHVAARPHVSVGLLAPS